MLYEEFEKITGLEIDFEDYTEVIEPMYGALTMDKYQFCEMIKPTAKVMAKRYAEEASKKRMAEQKLVLGAMETEAAVKIHYSDGSVNETRYDDRWAAFRAAAKAVAFRDLEDDIGEVELFVDNELFEYDGWRPGMEIAFVSPETKEEMIGWFPEWDH